MECFIYTPDTSSKHCFLYSKMCRSIIPYFNTTVFCIFVCFGGMRCKNFYSCHNNLNPAVPIQDFFLFVFFFILVSIEIKIKVKKYFNHPQMGKLTILSFVLLCFKKAKTFCNSAQTWMT